MLYSVPRNNKGIIFWQEEEKGNESCILFYAEKKIKSTKKVISICCFIKTQSVILKVF